MEKYNPEMVDKILKAAKAKPVKSFKSAKEFNELLASLLSKNGQI